MVASICTGIRRLHRFPQVGSAEFFATVLLSTGRFMPPHLLSAERDDQHV
jgi:hypothetical protein